MLRVLLALCLSIVGLNSQSWGPIPADAWTIGATTDPKAQGAVVLEDHTRFGMVETIHRRRVRIFAPAGLAAAEIPWLSSKASVKARTTFRDGKETLVLQRADLLEQEVRLGRSEFQLKKLVPPGVTSDCIVDLEWIEPYSHIRSYLFYSGMVPKLNRPLHLAFPIRHALIEIDERSQLSTVFLGGTKFNVAKSVGKGYRKFELRNLPALEPLPFSLPHMRENPVLFGWSQAPRLREAVKKGLPEYWKTLAEEYLAPGYLDLNQGGKYRRLRDDLLKDLSGSEFERGGALLHRLESRVINLDACSSQELASLPSEAWEEYRHPEDLNESAARGRTNGLGMTNLYFQLLRDAGLKPKLFFGASREGLPVYPTLPCPSQFDTVLVGLDRPGSGMIWFSPHQRFFPQGLIPPEVQGTQGMVFDPESKNLVVYNMPVKPASTGQAGHEYSLDVLDDQISLSLKTRFAGHLEYDERRRYWALEEKDQVKALKRKFEADHQLSVGEAQVSHAQNPSANLELQLKGSIPLDPGRQPAIHPFPGLSLPFSFPDAWPMDRTEPIALPPCQVHSAHSRIILPTAASWVPEPGFEFENPFGKIQWKARIVGSSDRPTVEVDLRVQSDMMYAPASDYRALREFMENLRKALTLTVRYSPSR